MSINRRSALFGGLIALFIGMVGANATANAEISHKKTKRVHDRPRKGKIMVYFGTYTTGKSKGIYSYRFNQETGELTPTGLTTMSSSPSFLAFHPNKRFLYAVNEISDYEGKKTGGVSSFAINPQTGHLTPINEKASQGESPCHLVVDKSGKYVLVANYSSGTLAVLPILQDGSLSDASCVIQHMGSSVNPDRQKEPHAHSINLDAENRFAIAADLGIDKVMVYKFDNQNGKLIPNNPAFAQTAPGAGPRHFAFHPNGHYGYVINELNSTVTAFKYDASHGSLNEIQAISTLPPHFTGTNYPAEVVAHPSGKFLYGSNRGHDSIALFHIDSSTGKLKWISTEPTQGKFPRNFCIDPTGHFLLAASQNSDVIVVFKIDLNTGKLTPTGHKIEVPAPVCIRFLELGG